MTLSAPSALAASTSLSMPPSAAASVAVFAALFDDPPLHAAAINTAPPSSAVSLDVALVTDGSSRRPERSCSPVARIHAPTCDRLLLGDVTPVRRRTFVRSAVYAASDQPFVNVR